MRGFSLVTVCLLFISFLTSCAYEIVGGPDHLSIDAPGEEKPLRLVVGLSGTVEILPNAAPLLLDGEFQELKALFAQRLQGFSLFQKVLYPAVSHDRTDLSLRVFMQIQFERDWTEIPKILLTQLLFGLPATLFHVEHHFVAKGDLGIMHRDQIVKKYTASSDVIIRREMFAIPPRMVWQQAASRARDSMMADLLHQLDEDREFLSQFETSL